MVFSDWSVGVYGNEVGRGLVERPSDIHRIRIILLILNRFCSFLDHKLQEGY